MRHKFAIASSDARIAVVVALVLASFAAFLPSVALAAPPQLQDTLMRLDNMSASSATGGTVCLKGKTSTNTDFLLVQFPSQFTLGTTLGNWTTSLTPPSGPGSGSLYWPSTASAFPTTLTATNVNTGTNTVTFQYGTATNLGTSTLYCFDWTNQTLSVTSTGSAGLDLQGNVTTETAASAVIDEGYYALTIITSNQIVISAVVPPIFEFTMPANVDSFTTNLGPSTTAVTSGVTPTIKTNAKGGWIMWAYDKNQALTSSSSGGSIPSVTWNSNAPTTLTHGTAGYALDVVKSIAGGTFCTETVAPEYDTVTSGGNGGEFWGHWEQIGTCAGGPSNGDGFDISEAATVSVTTPASTDYTDTVYVAGAGDF